MNSLKKRPTLPVITYKKTQGARLVNRTNIQDETLVKMHNIPHIKYFKQIV